MAIQNDSTLLCKGDLKAYHESIAPYLGGNLMIATNVSDFYSTDEKIVGVWTDGKPIYQKTIVTTTASNSSEKAIYDVTGLNIIGVPQFRLAWQSGSDKGYIWDNRATGESTNVDFYTRGNTLYVQTADSSFYGKELIVTLQYTKTTDAVNSAVATPGCYDINRPDLWPIGQEIFFGNGLYGKRFAGNTPDLASGGNKTSIQLAPPDTFTNARMFSFGGNITAYNSSDQLCIHPIGSKSINTTVEPEYQGYHIDSGIYFTGDGRLQFGVMAGDHHITTSNTYDVWILYTK